MKSIYKTLTLLTVYCVLSTGTIAQNVVITDDDTYTPTSTNALLEVKPGSNDKGVLIPRLTSTERTAITMSAAADKGLLVYDTDTKSFWYYDGTAWVEIGATSSGMADADGDTKIQVEETADDDNIRFDVAGTEAMAIDENANVGIGTGNPANKFDVIGDVGIFGSSSDAEGIKLQTDYTNGQTSSRLFFCETQDDKYGFSWIYAGDTDPTFDGISHTLPSNTFYLTRNSNSTSADVVMSFLRSNGNIGISTTIPSALLEVYQQGGYINETIDQQQTSTMNSGITEQAILWQSFTAGASGYLSKIDFWDGGNSVGTFIMKIYKGQGTGGTLLGTANTVNRNNSGWEYVSFTFPNPISLTATQQYTFAVEVSGTYWDTDINEGNPYSGGVVYYDGIIYSDNDTRFKTYVASSYNDAGSFVVKDNGNVGIGTTSPGAKLDLGSVAIGADEEVLKIGIDGEYAASIKFFDDDDEANQHFKMTFSAASQDLKFHSDNADNILYLDYSGQVGIGTNAPDNSKLQIEGSNTYDGMLRLNNTGTNGAGFFMGSTNDAWSVGSNLFIMGHGSPSSANTDVVINSDGYVGIGTGSPSCPLEIEGYASLNPGSYGYLNSLGNTGTSGGSAHYSIKASDRVMAWEFNAVSDHRIKTNINSSNISTDLEKVKQLRLTQYNYIDSIAKDHKQQKGFIAQEVEKVLPEAVNISSGFVPDIFVLATTIIKQEDKTLIEIPKEHKLQQGDLLRLITPTGQIETEVIENISPQRFAVKLDQNPEKIFVYGKKVDDFRAVNYDYIFSTGIGAIQELSLKVEKLESLQAEVEELKAMLGGSLQSAVDSRQ